MVLKKKFKFFETKKPFLENNYIFNELFQFQTALENS